MLSWAITFLIIAIVAAVLGFGGIAGTAAGSGRIASSRPANTLQCDQLKPSGDQRLCASGCR